MLGEQTDRQLVERLLAARDATAFEALVRRHGPMVYRVCWRVLQHAQDAEDAFQATFLLLARQVRSIRKPESMASWLHGVAHRVAHKARAQRTARDRHEKLFAANRVAPPHEASWGEVRSLIDEELQRLPEKWRLPLILCYLEGRTQEAAAGQLGWSKSAFGRRLEEAREALGQRLVRRGFGWSAALCAPLLSDCVASAALPPRLVGLTVEAATQVTAGGAAASVVSAKVAALTEGVLKTMLLTKLKIATAVLVMVAVVAAGASLMRLPVPAAEPPKTGKPGAKDGAKPEPAKPVVVRQDALLQRMAMSPDGEVLATVGVSVTFNDFRIYNSTVKLWDARTLKLKRALDVEQDSHLELALSRDFLAIGVNGKLQDTNPRGPREVRLLDAKTLELKHKIDGPMEKGFSFSWGYLAFSPDGKRLAMGGFDEGGFVKLWDVEKQKLIEGKADLGEIERDLNQVGSLVYSPDGKLVAAAWDDAKIRLFDGQTGDFKTLLDPELKLADGPSVRGIAFSPDSKTLASKGRDNTLVLWDLTEGKPGRTLKGHKGQVTAVAFSRDGQCIAAGTYGPAIDQEYEVIVWDAKTGKVKQTFTDLKEPVHEIAFSPDGKTLTVCGGGGRGEGKDTKMTGEIWLFPLD